MASEWGFVPDAFEVPITDGAAALEEKLKDVRGQWGGLEDCLVVVVVHGFMAVHAGTGRLLWTPFINSYSNRQLDNTSIDWHTAKKALEVHLSGHLAYIYDVHFIGHYVGPPQGRDKDIEICAVFPHTLIDLLNVGGKYHGRGEILASNCWGENKIGQLIGYLVKLVTDVLRERKGAPITIAQVFTSVYQKSLDLDYEILPVHIAAEETPSISLKKLASQSSEVLPETPWVGYDGHDGSGMPFSASKETNPFSSLSTLAIAENTRIASTTQREADTPVPDAMTPGRPRSLTPGADLPDAEDVMDIYLPEDAGNEDSRLNYDRAVTPASYHASSPGASQGEPDLISEASVEFVLEPGSGVDGRRGGASRNKGKEKVVLDRAGEEAGRNVHSSLFSTTSVLLTASVLAPGPGDARDLVRRELGTLFESWRSLWCLSGVAAVENVKTETGKFGGVFVVVSVPVEVWTMLGLWSGWQFLEVVAVGSEDEEKGVGEENIEMGMGDESVEMEMSEDE